jgi:hypothetical protein
MKNKIKIIGGDKKTTKTLEQLIRMFHSMPVEQIKTNLMEYTTNQMVKLYKILKQREDKVMNQLTLDYQNRKGLIKQVESEIPNPYDNIRVSYIKQLEMDVNRFTDQIRDSNLAVQEIEESIKKFKSARDRLTDESYVEKYREKCIELFLNDKVSEAFNEYKLELLEYLIAVLNGKTPQQHPFNIIITGSPGLGKSHLAGEIVKILQATHLLPVGKLLNLKKPDVIGQYLGQTAPKAYKNLVNGIGSIVFIDEAYSFAGKYREGQGYDRFGVEFIDALVDFMEEFRGLLGIIAAGYEKEMKEQFLDVNVGLNRRFRTKLKMKELDPITIITRLYEKIKNNDIFDTHYIENFVRFAYHIEQYQINQIRLIVYNDATGRYEAVTEPQASYILTHYFNKLFLDNWTDILALFDYFQFNNSFDYTVEEQLQNVITEFIRSKAKSSDVLEISSRIFEGNIVLQLKIKKLDWSNENINLLDNAEFHTEQDHLEDIIREIYKSDRTSVNSSDRNATVQEIEKRLNKSQVSLEKSNTLGAISSFNNGFGSPPPLRLTRTNTESYFDRKYSQRYSESAPATNSKNQEPPLLTLQGLNTERPPAQPAPPLLSFSNSVANSKPLAPAPAKNKKEKESPLPTIEEESSSSPAPLAPLFSFSQGSTNRSSIFSAKLKTNNNATSNATVPKAAPPAGKKDKKKK